MSDYTPTTEQVRESFRSAWLDPDDLDLDDAPGQAFDAWLAKRDAEVQRLERRSIATQLRGFVTADDHKPVAAFHNVADWLEARS